MIIIPGPNVYFRSSEGTPPFTPDFVENFENVSGYDNTGWSSTGTVNPDYTTSPAPLQGNQSCLLSNGSIYRSVSSTISHVFLMFNISTHTSYSDLGFFRDAGSNVLGGFMLGDTANRLILQHGAITINCSTSISTNTTYYVWLDWTKGTGTNGQTSLYLSTTSTKPGVADGTITNGTATADVAEYICRNLGVGIVDHIILNSTTIPSNP